MARDRANIRISIWADEEFRALSPVAQHLYFVVLTQPGLSSCGVIDWRPAKLTGFAKGWTREHILRASQELVTGRFFLLDEDTEEMLVRTFVRHDGVIQNPKMAQAVCKAVIEVGSATLREAIADELRKLRANHPELSIWTSPYSGRNLAEIIGMGMPLPPEPVLQPVPDTQSDTQSDRVSKSVNTATTTATPTGKNSLDQAAPDPSITQRFDEFWSAYPRKVGKAQARRAYDVALKRVGSDVILQGAARYASDPNRVAEFTAHPTTWLRRDGWTDEPEPARTTPLRAVPAEGMTKPPVDWMNPPVRSAR